METLGKLICWLIWVGIEVFIGWLIHFIPGTFGQAFLIAYGIVAFGLAEIFAIGLSEGDF